MNIQNQEIKTRLIKRLKRVEGQIRGLQAMLEEERDCREILQQFSAISGAVKSSSRSFYQDYATLCLADLGADPSPQQQERGRELLGEMLSLLDKTP
jgi:DNA-binding FrmR family transcriptional regulator